ncbi:hypothetical protein GGS24DRAFT_515388 [Hypoxylon argillaceum]|nr:hypothetical protein GGS24DRAFT_515388 [Hypoxylon argillaceum]
MCQLHPGAAQQSGARERDITIERIDIVVLPSIEDNLCTDSNSSTYNWLRDSLSNDFPLTRILLFHHSEGCITHTSIGLDQYFLDTLLRLRKRDPFRPIIFIADSRRSVFLRGALANSVHKAVYKSIKESVRGIVFLSTTAGRATYTPPPHTSRSLYSILHAGIARDPIKLSGPYHDKPYSIQSPEAPVKSCKTLHCPSFLAYWNTLRIVSLQSLEASQASCKRPIFSNHWPSESGSVIISYGKTAKFNSLDREQYCVLRDSVSWLIQWVYELDDLLSIENDISDPLNGTCAWIWSNATFQAWLDSETDRRLLISGKGGSGKSVLAKYIARSLAAGNRPSHSLSGYSIGPWRCTGRVVGVYCDYKFPPQSAESIFRYILHQLLADTPALIKDINECDGAVQRDVDNTLETWSQETSAGSLPVRLKVLMTSRQYVPLLRGIGPGIDLAQDECAPGLSHDAFLVVGAGVESLHKLDERMVKALKPTIENLIFGENTVGVLLWARLASNSAQSLSCAQSDADSLLRYLTNLPTSLFALYDLIFD